MKKFYLTLNPHGGQQKGPRLLKQILPVLEATNVELTIIETTFAGHANELAHKLDFDGYDGMIVIGGDGTMHEVVNGMLTRLDKKQLPIGLIPGGTGNSFMHDLELMNPVDAVKAIISGNTRQIDVAEVKINDMIKYAFNIIGILGLILSIFIFFAGFNIFKSYEENPVPTSSTNRIIKTGIFAYTRNPIYLAFVMIHLSMFLVFENVMYFLSAVGLSIWLHNYVIKSEENFLLIKFPDEYDRYMKAVKRWLFL